MSLKYGKNEEQHPTEVILHQRDDELYGDSSSHKKENISFASEKIIGAFSNTNELVKDESSGYSKTVNNSATLSTHRGPVVLSHLSPAKSQQLNQRRRNNRRGLSADRGKILINVLYFTKKMHFSYMNTNSIISYPNK